MEIATKEGKYLYCVIAEGNHKTFGQLGIGNGGEELHTICFDGIAAVVSNSPIKDYSVSRENLLAHERAIEEVMNTYTVLPVSFCTIAEDEENVKAILKREYHKFRELIKSMENKKELGLRATFKEGIYSRILKKYEEIKVLKEKIANLPPEKTSYQKIEIGRMVEAALQKERQIYKAAILGRLLPLAVDSRINSTYGERMIMNTAFLIKKKDEGKFYSAVNEFETQFGSEVNFKYVGTVPPFNFVHLVIEKMRVSNVSDR